MLTVVSIVALLASSAIATGTTPVLFRRQLVPVPCSEQGLKDCGEGCIPFTSTCCPDLAGGCPPTSVCWLGTNGAYGCCPLGEVCAGPGGAVTSDSTITRTNTLTQTFESSSTSTTTTTAKAPETTSVTAETTTSITSMPTTTAASITLPTYPTTSSNSSTTTTSRVPIQVNGVGGVKDKGLVVTLLLCVAVILAL